MAGHEDPKPPEASVATVRRTSIRLVDVADANAIAVHRARDLKAFERWEPRLPPDFYTTEGQRRRIERMLGRHEQGEQWPGVVLADGEVIGQVTVNTIVRGPCLKGSLGYWVATTDQGRGHASRAVALVLDVMREQLGLHRAEATTHLENIPSQHVLRSGGFTPYGVAHSHIFINGAWRDSLLWERVLDDGPPRCETVPISG